MKKYFCLFPILCILVVLASLSLAAEDKPTPAPATPAFTEVEQLRMQNLRLQKVVLEQQAQIVRLRMEQLIVDAKVEFEGVAQNHKLDQVFNPMTFELVPAPKQAPTPSPTPEPAKLEGK